MTTTKKIEAGRYIDWNTYEDCGMVELTKTGRKVEYRFDGRYYTRVAWKAEDGTTWVYMSGQFNELDTEHYYGGPVLTYKTRFGNAVA